MLVDLQQCGCNVAVGVYYTVYVLCTLVKRRFWVVLFLFGLALSVHINQNRTQTKTKKTKYQTNQKYFESTVQQR